MAINRTTSCACPSARAGTVDQLDRQASTVEAHFGRGVVGIQARTDAARGCRAVRPQLQGLLIRDD